VSAPDSSNPFDDDDSSAEPYRDEQRDNPNQDRYLRSLDRDYAEEVYWKDYCGGCDRSPCPEGGRCTDWPDQNSDLRFLNGGLK